jgi:phosphoglucomutase
MNAEELKGLARHRAAAWTEGPYDAGTRSEVQHMMEADGEELVESFYTDLEFGTGGLRGLMGPGTNRMNRYTVAQATQGLAQYVLKAQPQNARVAIAHDSRNGSPEFARVAAEVLAGNGIEVHLFPALRPTPQLSFTVRHLKCTSGIVITASHNPKEYNGYKVYWNDGGQIVPPHDHGIIQEVRGVEGPNAVHWGKDESSQSRIHITTSAVDEAYLQTVTDLRMDQNLIENGSDLLIVYTPLHGTGSVSVIPALARAGFRNVHIVESQRNPDGNFPTVHSPNPEEGAALSAAIELAREVNAQLVLGTDPDSDRVGIAVPDAKASGGWRLLNGNETGALLVDYVVNGRAANGTLKPGFDFVAKTIVTSDLMAEIGKSAGLDVHETLTGFKWIAAAIREQEGKGRFVVGGEESYGYMIGDAVRDKDAVAAACLICEMAHSAQREGLDMLGRLERIHRNHGAYLEALVSQTKQGRAGKKEIAEQMETFRSNPPAKFGDERVVELRDYQAQTQTNLIENTSRPIELPSSNVIQMITEHGSIVTARPSGTEPKIKFYFSVRMDKASLAKASSYDAAMQMLQHRIDSLKLALGVG